MNFKLKALTFAMTTALVSNSAMAANQADDLSVLQQQVKTLQTQINGLANQVEQPSGTAQNKTHIGGYGELHYNNISGNDPKIDFHRFVLFFGHEFSDDIRFFSEFELEHSIAADGENGEVELEQAYIEMDLTDQLKTTAGVSLVPVGIMNETHEPDTFYGTERNPVEKNIIPATWWNAALGLHGVSNSGLSYDLTLSEGLNIASGDGYSIRKGRQKTSKAKASNLAYTGRLKYTGLPGLELAITARHESDLGQGTRTYIGAATLLETHAIYSQQAFTVKALYAQWQLDGSGAKTANAETQYGWYIEPSYKVSEKLGVFARLNEWNTSSDGSKKETQTDFGLNYWPHQQVVFKADYQLNNNGSSADTSGFNLGVGYSF